MPPPWGAFAGNKVIAVAKNYAAHKVEMGGTPQRLATPVLFLKPRTSVLAPGFPLTLPRLPLGTIHHEVELGVVISKPACNVAAKDWRGYVGGYCLALDMTARDAQATAKSSGMPWTLGKAWDGSCPLSPPVKGGADGLRDPHDCVLWLAVDGVEKQRASTGGMLHRIPELLEYVTSWMTLEPGDVLLTGTPEGVGPVTPGQVITCGLEEGGQSVVEMVFPVLAHGQRD